MGRKHLYTQSVVGVAWREEGREGGRKGGREEGRERGREGCLGKREVITMHGQRPYGTQECTKIVHLHVTRKLSKFYLSQ